MIYYLWVFILSSIAVISLISFLILITKDVNLIKKIKVKKSSLVLDFSLLLISISSISLVIYLFIELKKQIDILS